MIILLLFLCGTSFCNSFSSLITCTVSHDLHQYDVNVDCHGRGLTEIPKHFPVNTTSINLSDNLISSLKNYSFIGVPKLRSLDMSSNLISSIEPHSLWKCQSLKKLNIRDNKICVNGSVFNHLGNLQELVIDDCYDAAVFKPLTDLITIHIVANQECNFQGFHYLLSVRNLGISGSFYCRNNTFETLYNSSIRSLSIDADLVHMEVNALAPLIHLQELKFTGTSIGLSKPLDALYALVGRNLTKLVLYHSRDHVMKLEDRALTKKRLKYLSQICLSSFSAPNNKIVFFDLEYIENSPIAKCLKHLDLSRNMLTAFPIQVFLQLSRLTKFEYLDISNQAVFSISQSPGKQSKRSSDVSIWDTHMKGGIFYVDVPEFLKTLILSRISDSMDGFDIDINIRKGQHLETVDLSFNGLTNIKHVYGVPNIKYVDFSGNDELVLPNDFFCSMKKVRTLKMTDMSLRQNVADTQGEMFLNCLPQLRTFDISGNRLIELQSNLFKLNPLLEYLDLSRNIFITVPVHLNLLPNLHVLDVSSNSFGSLDKKTLENIDKHYLKTKGLFEFRLNGIFFECSCGNLPFLFWLSETRVLAGRNVAFPCITEDGRITQTREITINILKFWRKCKGVETFALSMILGPFLLCCIFVALLIETNKTKLAFFLINALKYHVPKRRRKDFKRDVYVSYADADYRWACFELCAILEERNLNLFIWDRDSVPGDCTAEVITETVNQCWKTILYFTENYERDAWSYLTTMAAVNCVDNRNPERLILLLPENETPRVPECLLQLVPESCIFYVPREISRNDAFWDDLEQFIKHET